MSIVIGQHGLRFAFVPLYQRAQRDSGRWAFKDDPLLSTSGIAFTLENLAEALDVTPAMVRKQAQRGWMNEDMADRYATALGYHVVDIWPDYFEMVEEWERVDAERKEQARARHNERQRAYAGRKAELRRIREGRACATA